MSKSGNCYPAENDILSRLRSLSRRKDFLPENKNRIDVTCLSNYFEQSEIQTIGLPLQKEDTFPKRQPIRNEDDEIAHFNFYK